jgi:hypothetical protein
MSRLFEHHRKGGSRSRAEIETATVRGQALGQGDEKATQKTTIARIVRRVFVKIVFRLLLFRGQKLVRLHKDQVAGRAAEILTAVGVERSPC